MNLVSERRLLQAATALACIVPISMGAMSIVEGASILRGVDRASSVDLDSHFRYLSGLLLGIGIMFAAAIPRIESEGPLIRRLGALVIIGGLARLISLIEVGMPGRGHQIGLVIELVAVPLILLWQARVARRFSRIS